MRSLWRELPSLAVLSLSVASAGGQQAEPDLLLQAEHLRTGTAGRFDPHRSHELYRQAAESGDPVTVMQLATLRHLGLARFPKDESKGDREAATVLPAINELARAGDARAQYLLGTSLLSGIGQNADPSRALEWLQRAAAQRQVWALYNLGWMYASGTGVDVDLGKAFDWYRRSADAGNVNAMTDVAYRLLEGIGVSPDPDRAIAYLERAIATGYPPAMTYLGRIYGWGGAIESDLSRALELLTDAVIAGEPSSSDELHTPDRHPGRLRQCSRTGGAQTSRGGG